MGWLCWRGQWIPIMQVWWQMSSGSWLQCPLWSKLTLFSRLIKISFLPTINSQGDHDENEEDHWSEPDGVFCTVWPSVTLLVQGCQKFELHLALGGVTLPSSTPKSNLLSFKYCFGRKSTSCILLIKKKVPLSHTFITDLH